MKSSAGSAAPPSYDDLFGSPSPDNRSTNRLSTHSPGASTPPRTSPQNSYSNAYSGLFQNSHAFLDTNGPSRPPGSPSHDNLSRSASDRSYHHHHQHHSHPHHHHSPSGSLHGHRVDPSAPQPDLMENLRVAIQAASLSPAHKQPGHLPSSSSSSSLPTNANYFPPEPSAPTPNWQEREEENELRMWFTAVDENDDGYVTTVELQQALLNDNYTTFSMDTIQMILKMFDKDFNNRIDFDEFRQVKKYVTGWKSIFDRYDADRSGTIDCREIREALLGLGHTVSMAFCEKLSHRFCQSTPGKINLDAFIYICATIASMDKDYRRSSNRNKTFEEVLLKWIR